MDGRAVSVAASAQAAPCLTFRSCLDSEPDMSFQLPLKSSCPKSQHEFQKIGSRDFYQTEKAGAAEALHYRT